MAGENKLSEDVLIRGDIRAERKRTNRDCRNCAWLNRWVEARRVPGDPIGKCERLDNLVFDHIRIGLILYRPNFEGRECPHYEPVEVIE